MSLELEPIPELDVEALALLDVGEATYELATKLNEALAAINNLRTSVEIRGSNKYLSEKLPDEEPAVEEPNAID